MSSPNHIVAITDYLIDSLKAAFGDSLAPVERYPESGTAIIVSSQLPQVTPACFVEVGGFSSIDYANTRELDMAVRFNIHIATIPEAENALEEVLVVAAQVAQHINAQPRFNESCDRFEIVSIEEQTNKVELADYLTWTVAVDVKILDGFTKEQDNFQATHVMLGNWDDAELTVIDGEEKLAIPEDKYEQIFPGDPEL